MKILKLLSSHFLYSSIFEKGSLLLIINFLTITFIFGQQPFITTWKTDNAGTSCPLCITIPTTGTGYNYDVDWNNDGTYDESGITGSVTHDFGTPGTYTIRIKGDFPRIYFNNEGDRLKLLSVDQWGDIHWETMEKAFFGCSKFNCFAIDTPDLTNVTDMSYMFAHCSIFKGILGNWDVSNVTNMSHLFDNATIFNNEIGSWNVSNVSDMSYMFEKCHFNKNIGNWDVSKVKNMRSMFSQAFFFNKNIENWDVRNVTDMSKMFYETYTFNQILGNWNVAKVNNMKEMFCKSVFNLEIGSWDVENVTDMSSMFNQSKFDKDIGNWEVWNVSDMSCMFCNTNFNKSLEKWNVGNVVNMSCMFCNTEFDHEIGEWNVENVKDMSYMFGLSMFNRDIGNWNVSNVTKMNGMFHDSYFNQYIGDWNVGNVIYMSNMFSRAFYFDQDIGKWDVGRVTDMSYMFLGAKTFNQNIGTWNIENVVEMRQILDYTGLDIIAYDSTIIAWSSKSVQPNINFGAQDLKYCNSETHRKYLIDNYNWTFDGDTKDCSSLGLEDYSEYKIEICPNPTTGNITIEGIQNAEIKVYDCLGRKVLENRFKDNKIDISDQPVGIYFLYIQDHDRLITRKLIKK